MSKTVKKKPEYTNDLDIKWKWFRPPEFNLSKALEIIRVVALIAAIVLLIWVRSLLQDVIDGQEESRKRGLHIICNTSDLNDYKDCE